MGIPEKIAIPPLVSTVLAQEQVTDLDLAKRLFKSGEGHYRKGYYEEALVEFERSYVLSRKPKLQYNIARTFEKLERYDKAIETYQRYLQKMPDTEDRVFVEERIVELQAKVKPSQEKTKPIPTIIRDKENPPGPSTVYISPPAPPRKKYRPYMWSSAGLFAASLTLGLASYLTARNNQKGYADGVNKLKREGYIREGPSGSLRFANAQAQAEHQDELNTLSNATDTYGNAAVAGLIGAGAFLISGAIFYGLDRGPTTIALGANEGGGKVQIGVEF